MTQGGGEVTENRVSSTEGERLVDADETVDGVAARPPGYLPRRTG